MSDVFRPNAPEYWARGLSVIPLEPGSKRPAKELVERLAAVLAALSREDLCWHFAKKLRP